MKDINNAKTLNDKDLEKVVGGIDQNEAFSLALQHAGVPAEGVWKKKWELEYGLNGPYYELEFEFQGMEYEYKIDANGNILKAKKEWDD